MAGSYKHVVDDEGKFLEPEEFSEMIENLGDAYEMAEEMYAMIWYLAKKLERTSYRFTRAKVVEEARQNYKVGMTYSPSDRLARF